MLLAYQLWKGPRGAAPRTVEAPRPPGSGQGRETDRILLLHGMGGTGALWRPVAASLEDSFDILAPDQRGHGRSQVEAAPGGAGPYSPLDFGRDLVETLDHLGFHPCWVVGHSIGVRSACALAHLKPDWIRGLVLVDLGFSGVAGGGLGEGLASFLSKLPMRFGSREEARQFMAVECPDPAIAQYLLAVSIRTADGGLTFPFDHGALIQTIHAARDISVRKWVEEASAAAARRCSCSEARAALSGTTRSSRPSARVSPASLPSGSRRFQGLDMGSRSKSGWSSWRDWSASSPTPESFVWSLESRAFCARRGEKLAVGRLILHHPLRARVGRRHGPFGFWPTITR